MNTLIIQEKLSDKYGYHPLSKDLSDKYRKFWIDNLPDICQEERLQPFYTKYGTQICWSYERIVIGDYGAFIEIAPNMALIDNFIIKKGQEWRINDPKYKVKYHWYTINDGSDIKIYFQKRVVKYADYKRGMYYISPYEMFLKA